MVTVLAIYSPTRDSPCYATTPFVSVRACHPTEVPRDQRQHIYFQWASAHWPHSCQRTQSYKRKVLAAQIYIPEYFHLQKILYTKKSCTESAFKELRSQLTTQLQA